MNIVEAMKKLENWVWLEDSGTDKSMYWDEGKWIVVDYNEEILYKGDSEEEAVHILLEGE